MSTWLARLVGQAGSLNPKILEKARLLPAVLVVTALEGSLLQFSFAPLSPQDSAILRAFGEEH